MIDWLRTGQQNATVTIAGQQLPIAIRRHPRARRLVMRLAPDGSEVRITLPSWGRTLDALTFARARAAWLEAQLSLVPQTAPVAPGSALAYRGRLLRIGWDSAHPRQPRLAGDTLECGGPLSALERRVRRWLEEEALRLAELDLANYCLLADHPVPALRLSRAQRRWGSCSGAKTGPAAAVRSIRINWRLVMAPDHVRRSVVAHEVAHLVHFDHSPAFHALLGRLFEGDLKAADGWLREQGRSLYSPFG